MPTYEYACTACAERMEVVQSFTDASLTECPACSGVLRKVYSPVGIVFKGSGFYKTDSRGKGGSSGSSGSTGSSDGAAETKTPTKPGDGGAKPDSKPAAKTEAGTTTPAASTGSGAGASATAAAS